MEQEKITVVIPMYNSEDYIKRCLNSICNQTYKNLEIIVVNAEGYDEYLNGIDTLIKDLQSNSKEKSISYATAIGDGWHDNFAFEDLKRQELKILQEINKKKQNIKNLVIVTESKKRKNYVNIDDVLRLKITFAKDEEEMGCFKLIGGIKPKEKEEYQEITLNSLLGKAIYNKKIGTIVKYILKDNNIIEVKIIEKGDVKNDKH